MEPIKFTATITGSVSPNGGDPDGIHTALTILELKENLHVAMQAILSNGGITRESPATVEDYSIKITTT